MYCCKDCAKILTTSSWHRHEVPGEMDIIHIILLSCNISGGIVRPMDSCSRRNIFSAAFRCPATYNISCELQHDHHRNLHYSRSVTVLYVHALYKHAECVLRTAAISGYSIILVYHFPINMCARLCECV